MKKLFTLLLFVLFVNTAISQTNTFTVYYFDVKSGMESSLADVFDSFYEGVEFKSGGVYLERMQRGDVSGTHRVVTFGELGKFGVADGQKTSQDWEQFRTNRIKFIEEGGPSYSGRITLSNGVDPFSKGYFSCMRLKFTNQKNLLLHIPKQWKKFGTMRAMQCYLEHMMLEHLEEQLILLLLVRII